MKQQFIDAVNAVVDTLEKDANDAQRIARSSFGIEEKAEAYGEADGVRHAVYVIRTKLLGPLLGSLLEDK